MFSLIFVVISIGLIVAITAATLNYMPLDAQQRQAMFKEADRGLKALECAVTRYLDWNRDPATRDINHLTMGVLSSSVVPQFGFMPAAVRKEMTWEVTASTLPSSATPVPPGQPTPTSPTAAQAGEAVAICLRPITSSTPMQREVLAKLQAQYPVGSAFIGSACNATANVANGAFLTYWVPVSHVN